MRRVQAGQRVDFHEPRHFMFIAAQVEAPAIAAAHRSPGGQGNSFGLGNLLVICRPHQAIVTMRLALLFVSIGIDIRLGVGAKHDLQCAKYFGLIAGSQNTDSEFPTGQESFDEHRLPKLGD
jgi:hypothetical protein